MKCLNKKIEPEYKRIFNILEDEVQIALFCLFSTEGIVYLLKNNLKNAARIMIESKIVVPKEVKQYYLLVEKFSMKEQFLADFLSNPNNNLTSDQIIIYINSAKRINKLKRMLADKGVEISCLNGSLDPSERSKIIADFKERKIKILVGVGSLLCNLFHKFENGTIITSDLQRNILFYNQRLNKLGSKGTFINLVLPREMDSLKRYEKKFNTEVNEWVFKLEE
jgi:ATP-dependent RNA helicase DDX19/DBP5